MGKQKSSPILCFSVFVLIAALCRPSAAVYAQTKPVEARAAAVFDQPIDPAATAKQELIAAARAYRVNIQADRIAYVSDGATTIVHAPVAELAKYKDTDFAAGVPILFLMVKSSLKLGVPNGSYLVKAQYQSGASSGKTIFMNSNGTVAVQRELLVRTWKQSGVLFPGAYTNPEPALIPNITSTHIVFWDSHGIPHYYIDCSGLSGTLYFEIG